MNKNYLMRNARKGPLALCEQRRLRSACVFAQADLSLRCPLRESFDTVVYVDERRMLKSDCTDEHVDQDLYC